MTASYYTAVWEIYRPIYLLWHPLIASVLIGVAQEADLVSPGFEQSTAISNHSTLDFTLHCGEQQIVLPMATHRGNGYALRACHQGETENAGVENTIRAKLQRWKMQE